MQLQFCRKKILLVINCSEILLFTSIRIRSKAFLFQRNISNEYEEFLNNRRIHYKIPVLMLIKTIPRLHNICYSIKHGTRGTHLKTTVVEGGEDSNSRVDVLQFSQKSSVKVRVHVAVDPGLKVVNKSWLLYGGSVDTRNYIETPLYWASWGKGKGTVNQGARYIRVQFTSIYT